MPMGLFDSSDNDLPLVLDASVVINLSACGAGADVLRAIKRRKMVCDVIHQELSRDPPAIRNDAARLRAWIDENLIDEIPLASIDDTPFLELVSGSAATTLDDGEAATIALAMSFDGAAILDERKAIRICAERYPNLRRGATTDLLLHEDVMATLGMTKTAEALFAALKDARMRVLSEHLPKVLTLLGPERASLCPSLPRRVRVLNWDEI
jgi:predicted nucleic acid-binding protein